MKNVKKSLCVPLVLLFALVLCSCARAVRVDYSELDRRLRKENELYAVNEKEILFSDPVYFAFLSLVSEDDILLAMREDGEKKLTQVSVTAGDGVPEGFKKTFTDFTAAVIRAFVPEKDAPSLLETLGGWEELLYTERFGRAESGRYTLELFSDPIGVSVIVTFV